MTQILEIGQSAPDFISKDDNSIAISWQDFASSWLVLYFYPKDNTPGCTTEAKDFTALSSQFSDLGAKIVGVSTDSEKSHCNFIAKHNLSIQLLSDPEHKLAESYGVWQLKKFMGKEYMGIVRSTFLIQPDRKVAYIWRKVKTKGHAEAVLEKLRDLVSV